MALDFLHIKCIFRLNRALCPSLVSYRPTPLLRSKEARLFSSSMGDVSRDHLFADHNMGNTENKKGLRQPQNENRSNSLWFSR